MTPDDRALVDRFLDMMAAEAGSSRHTLAAYRNDLERSAETLPSLGEATPDEVSRLGAQWAVLYGDYNKCIAGWTREFGYARWAVLRVAPGHACA